MYFEYRTVIPGGRQKRGVLQAKDRSDAFNQLKANNMVIASLEPLQDTLGIKSAWLKAKATKISKKDQMRFLEQIGFLFDAGIDQQGALTLLLNSDSDKKVRHIAQAMMADVTNGDSFDQAAENTGLFGQSVINQLRVGVQSGDISAAIKRCVKQLDDDVRLKSKITSAMIYPAFLVVMMVVSLYVLVTVMVPTMSEMVASYGGQLPALTQGMLAFATFVQHYGLYLVLLALLIMLLLRMAIAKSAILHQRVDKWLLKIPLIGGVALKLNMNRFCGNLSAMEQAGIPLTEALRTCADSLSNRYLRRQLLQAKELIETNGLDLALALQQTPGYPPLLVQMIAIGITTDYLIPILDKMAAQYEAEVDSRIKQAMSLVEPLLVLVMALMIGVIAAAMLMTTTAMLEVV